MGVLDDRVECVSLPLVDIAAERARVAELSRGKHSTQDGLKLALATEDPFLPRERVATQAPELDVLHSARHKRVGRVGIELHVKDLQVM